jgi:hypothetical protein
MALPLHAISLAYLFLPLVLFVAGWLRPPLALFFLALLAATGWAMRRELAWRVALPARSVIVAAIVALGWTALSGVAGLGNRNPDWVKHDAVLKGVVAEEWPVVYEGEVAGLDGFRHGLVFYLAYYLPAGAVGKLLGWEAALAVLALWTALGAWLSLCWFAHLMGAGGGAAGAAILFALASGLDAVGSIVRHGVPFGVSDHLEWWSELWQYPSHTSLLFWAPHQALGGWLVTALLLESTTRNEGPRAAPVAISGALLWSPFVALGALPLAIAGMAGAPRAALRFWPNWIAAPAIGALLVVYYAALRQERLPAAFEARSILGAQAGLYLLFVAVEFGAIWLLARPRPDAEPPSRAIWTIVALALLALPFFRLGHYNDLVMRVSIPALFTLWLFAGRAVFERSRPWLARSALAALLLLGAATPITELVRSLDGWRFAPPALRATRDLPVANPNSDLARQYAGPTDAFFFRRLAKMREGRFRPLP